MSGRIATTCAVAFVVVLLAYHWLLLITIAAGLGFAWRAGRRRQRAVMLRRLR